MWISLIGLSAIHLLYTALDSLQDSLNICFDFVMGALSYEIIDVFSFVILIA